MSELVNKFKIGDIVTDKTHPLFFDYRIKGDGRYVPPFMIIKEIFFENKQKKTHDDISGHQIAERIKYTCTYFDDNRSEFIDVVLYQSFLRNSSEIKIEIIDRTENIKRDDADIITSILNCKTSEYEYGKIISFKTKKLEIYKKRTSKKFFLDKDEITICGVEKTVRYIVNYATPEFILIGLKKENASDLFYPDGKTKKISYINLYKVKWFNPFLNKYSEQYLPDFFFTDKKIKTT
jgi:hypothetical protein